MTVHTATGAVGWPRALGGIEGATVVFHGENSGDAEQSEILCVAGGLDGSLGGTAVAVNAQHLGHQQRPSPAQLEGGDLVVAWGFGDGQDGDGLSVFARRIQPDCSPVAEPFAVNEATVGDQAAPVAGGLPGGGFVIAWRDNATTPKRSALVLLLHRELAPVVDEGSRVAVGAVPLG